MTKVPESPKSKTLNIILRIIIAVAFGGAFYAAWLVLYLVVWSREYFPESILRPLAPVVTALGFYTGMIIAAPDLRVKRRSLITAFLWPSAGCAAGALVAGRYGPMPVVTSMFMLGTLSTALGIVFFARRYNIG